MGINDWRYYNHAVIPSTGPHEEPDISCIKNKSIWKLNGGGVPFIARWTTDFDCGYETSWWYVVKDTPFDINTLKAKRRYEINKGKKNFQVKRINPTDYAEQLFNVLKCALESWPEKYRPIVSKDTFYKELSGWKEYLVYGGFDNNGLLCGFAYLKEHTSYLDFCVLRVNPQRERDGINAAMVFGILEDNNERLGKSFYICDGSRSIRHETAFQNYLEKYFGFRKAYCKLHIIYRFPLNLVVKVLYPFRKKISSENKIGSLLSSILRMEEYHRECE